MRNKIKDFFDVIKYKRQRNTVLNKYNSRNDDYITSLETIQTLTLEILNYQKQIVKYKDEIKKLKKEKEEKNDKVNN